MYIWTPRRWQIEKQIANYRVLDLVKLYNFDIKSISFEKSDDFIFLATIFKGGWGSRFLGSQPPLK